MGLIFLFGKKGDFISTVFSRFGYSEHRHFPVANATTKTISDGSSVKIVLFNSQFQPVDGLNFN